MKPEIAKLFLEAGVQQPPKQIIFNKKCRAKLSSEDDKKSVQYQIKKKNGGGIVSYHVHIKNFKTGDYVNKIVLGDGLDRQEQDHIYSYFQEHHEADEAKDFIRNETAAIEAAQSFNLGVESGHHPYLNSKRVKNLHGARIKEHSLLIPAYDIDGKLWSLQTIYPQGDSYKKIFHPGSTYSGCFLQIGELKDWLKEIFFAEGFATSATIHELTNRPVICCFSAGNLKNVMQLWRGKFPDHTFVILADQDEVGLKKAKDAAQTVSAIIHPPPFEFNHPDYTDWNDYYAHYGEEQTVSKILEFQNKDKEFTRQEWMKDWLDKHRVEINYQGVIRVLGKPSSADQLVRDIDLENDKQNKRIRTNLIHNYVSRYIEDKHRELFQALVSPMFEPPSIPKSLNDPMQDFIKACLGKPCHLSQKVVEHFIWQIKRKVRGLEVEHEMMPVFIGPEGGGKSKAIEKLLSPFAELSVSSSLAAFSDKTQWDIFITYPIIFMDEMAGAAKADMNFMKQVITSKTMTFRAPYDRKSKTAPNVSTLIGSSNEFLEEIVKDTTSNRRFFPLECQQKLDWKAINSINYLALWQHVDHMAECPIISILDEVRAVQAEHKNLSPVELWLEEVKEEPIAPCATSAKELYVNFRDWMRDNGMGNYYFTSTKFGRELRRLGYQKIKKRDSNMWTVKIKNVVAQSSHLDVMST